MSLLQPYTTEDCQSFIISLFAEKLQYSPIQTYTEYIHEKITWNHTILIN